MPIEAKVTNNQITATVGETKIDVAVGGGVGPTGSQGASGVVTVSAPLVNAGTASAAQLSLSVGAGLQVSGGSLALASHTHTASQITDFSAAVVAAAPPTTNASLLTSGTLPDARLSANIARTSDVTNALAGKAAASHTHAAGDIVSGTISADRLPVASSGSIGGVRIGSGISIDGSGVISASAGYTLPIATAGTLGGVRIGSGISIDPATGVISASSGYTLPTATANVLGGVKIGSGVTITDGVISVSTNYAAASHTHALADITDAGTAAASDVGDFAAASDFDQGVKTTDSPEFDALTLTSLNMASGDFTASSAGGSFRFSGFGRYIDFETGSIGHSGFNGWLFLGDVDFSGATVYGIDAADVGAATALHAHGAITSDGKVGSTAGLVLKTGTAGAVEALAQGTAGQVLKVNSGATGVEWGAAAADVSIDITAADVLSASSGSITADDPGADRLVFWDDSAGKLTHLTVSTGLSISGTTMTASVSASDISAGTLAYARMADPTVTSPSQITANQNDYASFARGINRFTTNAARDITGMVAGSDGEVRVLCNVGTTAANTLVIKDESSSSTAANRFSVPWNGDCVIPAEGSVVVFYDNTSSRWRVMA